MQNYAAQYKVLYIASWIALYLVYPAWISKHSLFLEKGVTSYALARSLLVTGLTAYFFISAYLVNRLFNAFAIDKPVIVEIHDWFNHIRNNLWFAAVCLVAVALQIQNIFLVLITTGGGEVPYLYQTVRIYDLLNGYWRSLFDFPLQYFFWASSALLVLAIKQKRIINNISNYISAKFSAYSSNNLGKLFFVFFLFGFFNAYSFLFPYYSYYEALPLLRFPPVSKFLYLAVYSAFGSSHFGPRVLQLIFYVLSAVYLCRTISLFEDKKTALLGASIYLFSPIIFSYATRAAFESGALFLMIIVSFYFMRFIKDKDDRDLVLASFFIGTGFLYKRGMLIMFVVCLTYLLYSRIMKRDSYSIIHFKIILLSLIPMLPWMKIGTSNPLIWSHLTSFDGLSIVALMIQSQVSMVIFILFMMSFIFILFNRKNHLSLFFGLLFCAYYLLFTLMEYGEFNHRYMMALYPVIAVLLAQFVSGFTQKMRWKHAFTFVSTILIVYLIIISLLPRSASNLITYKYKDHESQHFPVDRATDWIKNKTGEQDRVLSLFISGYWYYLDRVYPDREVFNREKFVMGVVGYNREEIIYSVKNLRKFCYEKNISYVMFPFGPNNTLTPAKPFIELLEMTKYLSENMDDEFIKAAEFNIEDNYIYIYKMK